MSLVIEVAGRTDTGCVRTNNEDNFGYDARYGIFVVCDGMGGAAAGEVASKLAVDTVLSYFREAAKTKVFPLVGKKFENVSTRANALASAIQLANEAIVETGANHDSRRGMGSTIVAILLEQNMCSIAHVGDSRIYMLRQGEIQQLTSDHSLVMEQVRRGLITREEAERSEISNIIIRALGSGDEVVPDVDDLFAMPGDVFLLASDGLTKMVKDEWIQGIIQDSRDLEQACADLIDAAKAHGGDDNITCMLVRLVEVPWYKAALNKVFPVRGRSAKQWQNSF